MCGSKTTRRLLVSFNVLFLMLSVALIAIGAWIFSDFKVILQYVPEHLSDDKVLIQDVGIAAMTIGCFAAIISFLGCVGAAHESRKVLFAFLAMMVIIFLAVLISGIVAVSRQELVKDVVRKTLESDETNNGTSLLKMAHSQYNCCGVYDMPTCDHAYPPFDVCTEGSELCQTGCLRKLWDMVFSPYMHVASIILFVLSGIAMIGVVLAIALFRSIGKGDYSYIRQIE